MNNKSFKQIVKKKEKRKICANHPVSVWKEGYRRCYWGFKFNEDCTDLKDCQHENTIHAGDSEHNDTRCIDCEITREKGGE